MDYYRLLLFEDISKKINPSQLGDKFSMYLTETKMVKQNILGGKPSHFNSSFKNQTPIFVELQAGSIGESEGCMIII